jgi:hypothetical protein
MDTVCLPDRSAGLPIKPTIRKEEKMDTAFFRIETYGRKTSSSKRRTLSGVIAEACRLKGGCSHVESPAVPRAVFGAISDVIEIPRMIDSLAELSEANSGIKVRDNLHLLLAGVCSFPKSKAELSESRECFDAYAMWCGLVMEFLEMEYGDSLHSVVEHADEKYVHWHFFVLPEVAQDWSIGVNHFHPGKVAEKKAKSGPDRIKLYKGAMDELQGRFHAIVGAKMGWSRRSANPRPRMSQKEIRLWNENQELKRKLEELEKSHANASKQTPASFL